MIEFAEVNHYDIIGSPKEIFLNSPFEVEEKDCLREIQLPVIKM